MQEHAARDLQAFLVFSQHLAWVYHAGKLIKKVFYCLNKKLEDDMIKQNMWEYTIRIYKTSPVQ